MQAGLEGRRIALYSGPKAEGVRAVVAALEQAGARVHRLSREDPDEAWHGGMYAALVLLGGNESIGSNPRLVQLVREFLVSDKPVASMSIPLEAIQVEESLLTVSGTGDPDAFGKQIVKTFSARLEEHDVDQMSEMSFPASDPPASTPTSTGHVAPDPEPRA